AYFIANTPIMHWTNRRRLPTVQCVAVDTRTRQPSSVALKILMAVTGILLVLFLFAHMAGNLKIFVGAESFNHYAHWLRDLGAPALPHEWFLWIQRGGLTIAVLGHIVAAVILA